MDPLGRLGYTLVRGIFQIPAIWLVLVMMRVTASFAIAAVLSFAIAFAASFCFITVNCPVCEKPLWISVFRRVKICYRCQSRVVLKGR